MVGGTLSRVWSGVVGEADGAVVGLAESDFPDTVETGEGATSSKGDRFERRWALHRLDVYPVFPRTDQVVT